MAIDEDSEAHFLRMTGRITAVEMMLSSVLQTVPNWPAVAKETVGSISAVANFMEASGDPKRVMIAIGMNEYLQSLSDSLDT